VVGRRLYGFYGGVSRAEFNGRVARFLWLLDGRAGVRVGISLDAERGTITDLDLDLDLGMDLGFFSFFLFLVPPFFFLLGYDYCNYHSESGSGVSPYPTLPYFLLSEHIFISSNNNYPFSLLTAVSMAKAKLRAQNTARRASTTLSRSSGTFVFFPLLFSFG
jgi:hypothetical protein